MAFSPAEIDYLASQSLARVATVGADAQPDVVPVAFEFDGSGFWIGGPGSSFLETRKVRNVLGGNPRIALVVDDLVSFDPFIARGVRVYGTAGEPRERDGMIGPGIYIRITPVASWSWNMAGEPVGDTWYETTRREHDGR